MRYMLPLSVIIIISTLLYSGCTPPAETDEPVRLALEALLASDEFTQEERDAIKSIKVHNNITTVWFIKDFTKDGKKISEFSQHIASIFAVEFYNVANKEHGYLVPKYEVRIYMKYTDKGETTKINPCDAWWDLNMGRLEVEPRGLGSMKGEIR